MKTISIAIPCLQMGGTEMQTLSLIRALRSAAFRIRLIAYFETDPLMLETVRPLCDELHLLHMDRGWNPLRQLLHLRRAFRPFRKDPMHLQYMNPGLLPVLAAASLGIPRILATVHQPWTPGHGKRAQQLLRFAAARCHAFISVSEHVQNSWFEGLPDSSRRHVIYNAIDTAFIAAHAASAPARQQLPGLEQLPPEAYCMGTISRIRHEKGIDVLLEAFLQAAPQAPDLHLVLVGDGPDRPALQAKGKASPYAERIHWCGAQAWEKALHYGAALDLIVIPSRFEGFGLSAAEAMALQKPLILSHTSGLKELIVEGESGRFFPNEDAAALARILLELHHQKALADQLAAAARQRVIARFDYPVFVDRTLHCYAQLGIHSPQQSPHP
ncbi:MAG: glycosyltransferase family 4 protein [Nitritalea sp.]